MKRHSLIYAAMVLVLVMLVASTALAVNGVKYRAGSFPNVKPGLNPTIGNCAVTLPIQQGWFNNAAAWYFCTDTNDITYASRQGLRLTPKLGSALDNGARKMYIVTNFNNVGPVFETAPRNYSLPPYSPEYSGLWEVIYVFWNPWATPHVIKNTDPESPTNPCGLPAIGVVTLSSTGFVQVVDGIPHAAPGPRIVVDCPIVALGTLEQPNNNPKFGGIYRIPQIIALDSKYKTITLPTWNVYCRNDITQKIEVQEVVITDVENPFLVAVLKANYAPGIGDVPFEDTQHFWIVNWLQPYKTNSVLVVPPTQYAVTEECPSTFPQPNMLPYYLGQNTNFDYTPVYESIVVNRNFTPECPGFTDKSVITSEEFIEILLGNNQLIVISSGDKLNAPNIMDRKVAVGAR